MPSIYTLLILYSYSPISSLINYYTIIYKVITYVIYTIYIYSTNSYSHTNTMFTTAFKDEFHYTISTIYIQYILYILSS